MIYLVDTNVLLRLADRRHELHPVVRTAMQKLRQDEHQLQVVAQNFIEFWNVSTRPKDRNGLGISPPGTVRLLRLFERLFPLLPDTPLIYPEWRRLVAVCEVVGVQAHDARLVAAMKVHGISRILTFDTSDFARYHSEGIEAVDPSSI